MTRSEKIEHIRAVPSELAAALEGISASELSASCRDGGWSVRQIVHHIADSSMHWYLRLMMMLVEDHPTIKPYEQDDYARTKGYEHDISSSVRIIAGLQERMADFFSDLKDADWSRGAYHPDNGEITLEWMLDISHDHGHHHIEQIRKARKLASG